MPTIKAMLLTFCPLCSREFVRTRRDTRDIGMGERLRKIFLPILTRICKRLSGVIFLLSTGGLFMGFPSAAKAFVDPVAIVDPTGRYLTIHFLQTVIPCQPISPPPGEILPSCSEPKWGLTVVGEGPGTGFLVGGRTHHVPIKLLARFAGRQT